MMLREKEMEEEYCVNMFKVNLLWLVYLFYMLSISISDPFPNQLTHWIYPEGVSLYL